MHDLAIIGGGPAGVAAGVYAARKQLKTVFIAETVGGQSTDSQEIQNWIGTPSISGMDLAKSLETHLRAYAADIVHIELGGRVTKIEKTPEGFTITAGEKTYTARGVLIATGGTRRKLTVPGADTYEHKGVTYCASCDGPLFSGQDVVVIGGGNAGFESAAQLLAYCKSVTLIHRGDTFSKADAATVTSVTAHPHMKALTNTEPVEVKGATFANTLVVKNVVSGEVRELPAAGIFVEIGAVPNTSFLEPMIVLDGMKRVVVDPMNQRVLSGGSEVPGLWAAGDCTNGLYHQNNIAAGDAVKALEDAYCYLVAKK